MSNLVIVAIPEQGDRVWKVSSEKVPHLTLLFLGEETGDVPRLDRVTGFIEHAVTVAEHGPFMLDVESRETLGTDEADVLMFRKGWDLKWIKWFREQLLQQTDIRTAYDSVQQFPEWQPHLTLGYPADPAKDQGDNPDVELDHPLHWVTFDRIAVWTGDFDGPEFRLQWPERWGDEVGWSQNTEAGAMFTEDMGADMGAFITHHGVKGMRWGVRKEDVSGAGKAVATVAKSGGGAVARGAKATGKFISDVDFEIATHPRHDDDGNETNSRAREQVIDQAHEDFHKKDLPAIQAKPEYQAAAKLRNRLLHPKDPATRAYRNEVKSAYINRLETTANSMKNASGTREYSIRERGGDLPTSKYLWEVSTREARHAAGKDFTLMEVLMDEDGFITGVQKSKEAAAAQHTADLGEQFLSHYGVKGMRWGVRNDRKADGSRDPYAFRKEENRGMFDPSHHDLGSDIFKAVVWPAVPPLGVFAIPADIRLARGAARGAKAKAIDINEKHFANHAHSAKNFAAIHNAAGPRIDREIPALNARHPGDLKSDPKKQKAYDDDVVKMMQGAYRESTNSIGNKPNTMHLDVEFKNDGMDFAIKAKQGAATPISQRVKHAAQDDTVELEYTGQVLRDDTGHFKGLTFNDPNQDPALLHTLDLGAQFLVHYGVKGMRWGHRTVPEPVSPSATSVVPHGSRMKTRIQVSGGENHPAHEDAIKVAEARAKMAKSGTKALSNKELEEMRKRLQLEEQVKGLVAPRGKKFVKNLLTNQTNQQANRFVQRKTQDAFG